VLCVLKIDAKKEIVKDLNERLAKSEVVILTDYKGLDVSQITALRKKLFEGEVEYQVVKKTLLTRACRDTDAALIEDSFKGPCAVAIGYGDPVVPAKLLMDFSKECENLEVKVGVMGGKRLESNDIKALSSLPSREVLLASVASALNAVPTSLARALNDVPQRFVNVLNALKEQKEAA
jgi:large subunit ribosomal protein L10